MHIYFIIDEILHDCGSLCLSERNDRVAQRVRNDKGQNIRVTLEVDFVCNKGSQRIYIQSAWRMPDADKMEQEKRSLRLVGDSFRKLLIVGEHTKSWSDDDGIQIISIYDFLLNPTVTD